MRKSLVRIPGGQLGQSAEAWELVAHSPMQPFAVRYSDADRMIQDEVVFLMGGKFYDMGCNPLPPQIQKKLLAAIPSSVTGVKSAPKETQTAAKDSGVDV